MSVCQTIQQWLPWYVSGQLSPAKVHRMATHIGHCEACRAELSSIVQLRHQFVMDVESSPTPSDRVWQAIAPKLDVPVRARIDMGSFLIGLNVGIATQDRRAPIQGDLRVLGRKVRIIGKQRKGA
jgi:predicted anti-sigma-YlaC factor YlaD